MSNRMWRRLMVVETPYEGIGRWASAWRCPMRFHGGGSTHSAFRLVRRAAGDARGTRCVATLRRGLVSAREPRSLARGHALALGALRLGARRDEGHRER